MRRHRSESPSTSWPRARLASKFREDHRAGPLAVVRLGLGPESPGSGRRGRTGDAAVLCLAGLVKVPGGDPDLGPHPAPLRHALLPRLSHGHCGQGCHPGAENDSVQEKSARTTVDDVRDPLELQPRLPSPEVGVGLGLRSTASELRLKPAPPDPELYRQMRDGHGPRGTAWCGSAPSGSAGPGQAARAVRTALATSRRFLIIGLGSPLRLTRTTWLGERPRSGR